MASVDGGRGIAFTWEGRCGSLCYGSADEGGGDLRVFTGTRWGEVWWRLTEEMDRKCLSFHTCMLGP